MEVVASLSQGRTAAAQCGLFTYKSVPVVFEPPCNIHRKEFFGFQLPITHLTLHFMQSCMGLFLNSYLECCRGNSYIFFVSVEERQNTN